MKHINKLAALTICMALILSGCAENKTAAAGETVTEITILEADDKVEEKTTATENAAFTVEAVTSETEVTEEVSAGTTTAAETTAGSTENDDNTQTSPAETGAAVTAEKTTETAAEPPSDIDENMFTLYLGGNTAAENYDVKIDSLPGNIVSELVKTLPEKDLSVIIGKDGDYSVSDEPYSSLGLDPALIEGMLSEQSYENMLPDLAGTEYENMTYEEFRVQMIDVFDEMFPGFKDMFDSSGNFSVSTEFGENICISYSHPDKKGSAYADETVIKEGVKAVFDSLRSSSEYQNIVSDAKKENQSISTTAYIMYDGGYTLVYSWSTASYGGNSGMAYNEGSVFLGAAKIYEKAPDTPTHYVIPADSELLSWINTDDNPYEMSVDIVADGYYADSIYIDESGYSNVMRNDAILGVIPEIKIGNFGSEPDDKLKEIRLYFRIKKPYLDNVIGTYAEKEPELKGIKRLNVFQFFDDINVTLPIETLFDVDENMVYVVTGICGTYCLYDMEMWFEKLGIDP